MPGKKEPAEKKSKELEKQITRRALHTLVKGFDAVKQPFSPLRRKLFQIFLFVRNDFDEVEKFQKELEDKLKEYNQKVFGIAKEHGDKDEAGELIQKVSERTGQVSWTFAQEGGEAGLKKLKALQKEYKAWLDYADPESDFSKYMSEKVPIKYLELEKHEVKKLSAANIIDLMPILPAELDEKDLPGDMTFEQMRILSENIRIKM